MNQILAQLPDPQSTQAMGWLVICFCVVVATITAAGVGVQKLIINQRILRREDVPQQVRVENDVQKRTIEMLPTIMTKTMCDDRHNNLAVGNENLIRLRTIEQIAAYETEAKKSRKILHDQIAVMQSELSAVKTEINGLKTWMKDTSETLRDVSNGLSNLAGASGKG